MLGYIWKSAAVLTVALAIGGCADLHRLPTDAKIDDPQESVIVLGLAPSNHRISIGKGSLTPGGRWHGPFVQLATFMGTAQDGYVLTKVSPGYAYAIRSMVVLQSPGQILGGRLYVACGESKTLVFSVPPGKVLYLTDLNFVEDNGQLRFTYASDFERARAYVDQNFPALKGRLEMGAFDFRVTTDECKGPGTVTTVVFLPGRR